MSHLVVDGLAFGFAIFVMGVSALRLAMLDWRKARFVYIIQYFAMLIGACSALKWAELGAVLLMIGIACQYLGSWKLWTGTEPPQWSKRK